MMPDFKKFSAISLFQGFTLHQLTAVFEKIQARAYNKGERILDSSSTELGFYFVIQGGVRISTRVNDMEMTLSMLYAGDFFGEASVVEGGAPGAEVIAEDAAVCYFLPRQDFLDLAASSSQMAALFWESLSRNLIARMKKSNATIQEYFAVNRQLCENPKFRELYRLCQFGN